MTEIRLVTHFCINKEIIKTMKTNEVMGRNDLLLINTTSFEVKETIKKFYFDRNRAQSKEYVKKIID